MKTKIAFILIVAGFTLASMYFSSYARNFVLDCANYAINVYENSLKFVKSNINEHFSQADQIRTLRERNAELEKSAGLLLAFAYELNGLLADKNITSFSPQIKPVRALSYAQIGDYGKVWLDFPDFNASKIYGLMFNGKSAGIAANEGGRALAYLQSDPKSVFSVYIGENKIAGIAKGAGKNIEIKFIAQWLEPKVGDEVFTSGLDGIFFGGIPVGKIVAVQDRDLYQSAVDEPYNKITIPSYLYVVIKDR